MQLHDPFGSLPALAGGCIFLGKIIMQNNAPKECTGRLSVHWSHLIETFDIITYWMNAGMLLIAAA
jgi:hypothetical protein